MSWNDIWEFGNGNGKFHSRSSGTGRELKKPIPSIWEREGNEKKPFPNFGNGKGMKKSIPKIREREGNEKNLFQQFGNRKGMKKIHSQNSGMGIRGYHSQEFPGTGTGMKKHNMTIKEKYLANIWRRKSFGPNILNPILLCS